MPRRASSLAAVVLLAACGGGGGGSAPEQPTAPAPPSPPAPPPPQPPPTAPLPPAETRPRNGLGQQPAFPNQTRAPQPSATDPYRVEVVATGLQQPWGLEFLPDGRMLVSEKPGRLRIVGADGALSAAITGVPAVSTDGQGGLLDVALAPDFATSRRVFWSYAEPRTGGAATAVASGVLAVSGAALTDVRVIFRQDPAYSSVVHFGSRLVFDRDGRLFVTTGDRGQGAPAQELAVHVGKVIRINADGSIPADNPFVGQTGARPEVWSLGHRNIQGAVLHPDTGRLWTVEHGAQGGDELNQPERRSNYGWPVITYGVNYDGQRIGEGTAKAGLEQPAYYWDPVIAPGGMDFYLGGLFPRWRGSLFIGGLQQNGLVRLTFDGDRVTSEERLNLGARIRDVKNGPDGRLYLLDESAGRIVRLSPP